ncbi:hypothetical protein [Chitinophaga sp. XS-30]|uniref:hypothetical protein n=1 Tax=Chitinophaga sp. XS-30 TaxID=2604421 RepID=UPI00143DF08A|nr:hypothetical protein [Chitinophaga sp. XS-30]
MHVPTTAIDRLPGYVLHMPPDELHSAATVHTLCRLTDRNTAYAKVRQNGDGANAAR